MKRRCRSTGLTVGVTGPTGDVGKALMRALDLSEQVERVIGLARRPFDPAAEGLRKVEHRQGDVLDQAAVWSLARESDVLVHLAWLIFGSVHKTRRVNLEGSRNVFQAALDNDVDRLVYASSGAAYGWSRPGARPQQNGAPLPEAAPVRGTPGHYYSTQKAESERMLAELTDGTDLSVSVFRISMVAGPSALSLVAKLPQSAAWTRTPHQLRSAWRALGVRPALASTDVSFQLLHEDDLAAALATAVMGRAAPGTFNLAGPDRFTMADLAHALGWAFVPVPRSAVAATQALAARLPIVGAQAGWLHALRSPLEMDISKAEHELGWSPRYEAAATLAQTVTSARRRRLIP